MAKVYRTAMGKQIDVEHLALTNEHVIAVGNMKVNAKGDELGPGGKVVKTRDQIMKEYYALNTPIAADPMDQIEQQHAPAKVKRQETLFYQQAVPEPTVEEVKFNPESGLDEFDEGPEVPQEATVEQEVELPTPVVPPMRGSMASSIAKPVTVEQKEKLPLKKMNGIQRF